MSNLERTIAMHRALRASLYPVSVACTITRKEFGNNEQKRSGESLGGVAENVGKDDARRRHQMDEEWRG